MPEHRGVFITGTDTGVGKTVVACALLELLAAQGLTTAAFKPVAAGARRTPRGLRNDDAERLRACATQQQTYSSVNPVVLEPAIAPHIAARQAGVDIRIGPLVENFRGLRRDAQFVVAEGAGGWLVPLDRRRTMADLARRLEVPIVLVVGLRLGCVNHALLTVENMDNNGLAPAGWIANQIQPDMPVLAENVAALDARIAAPRLGWIGWLGDREPGDQATAALAGLDTQSVRDALL